MLVAVVIGGLALLLPRAWTGRLASLTQIFLPFQDAVSSTADALLTSSADQPPLEALQAKAAAEHLAAGLALRVQQLEEDVRVLTATRLWNTAGSKIGARGRLIPARVVTGDLLPWRSSRLIDAGSRAGVSAGDPVTTSEFTIEHGEGEGVRGGLATLAGEVLIGFVEQAGSQAARVKLLSDPQSAMKVRLGRMTDQSFEGPLRYFWLEGAGPGRMEIKDVEAQDVAAGAVRVGDLVLSDPENELLPAAMMIGRIERIDPNRENPLFARVFVAAIVAEKQLRRVYVYDPGWEPDPAVPQP